MIRLFTLPAGFLLDLLMGDPRWLYHPVCLIGKLISVLEKGIRKVFPKSEKGELAGGVLEVILVCLITFLVPFGIIHLLYGWNFWAGFVLETFWCGQLLATRSLKDESMKVYDRLKNGTIEEARYAVSMIVGRDTQSLTEVGVTKAAVETVAENSSDGIIAPMLYMAIGGILLCFFTRESTLWIPCWVTKTTNTCILEDAPQSWTMWPTIFRPGLPAGLWPCPLFLWEWTPKMQ